MIIRNNIEKRKYQRIRMPEDTIAISLDGIGRIVEMSEGGFSVEFIDRFMNAGDSWSTDILLKNLFHEKEITVTVKWAGEKEYSNMASLKTQRVGFKFMDFSSLQHERIKIILNRHGK